MAKIKIKDIQPQGTDLFQDNESFLTELNGDELGNLTGGLAVNQVSVQINRTIFTSPIIINIPIKTIGTPVIL